MRQRSEMSREATSLDRAHEIVTDNPGRSIQSTVVLHGSPDWTAKAGRQRAGGHDLPGLKAREPRLVGEDMHEIGACEQRAAKHIRTDPLASSTPSRESATMRTDPAASGAQSSIPETATYVPTTRAPCRGERSDCVHSLEFANPETGIAQTQSPALSIRPTRGSRSRHRSRAASVRNARGFRARSEAGGTA